MTYLVGIQRQGHWMLRPGVLRSMTKVMYFMNSALFSLTEFLFFTFNMQRRTSKLGIALEWKVNDCRAFHCFRAANRNGFHFHSPTSRELRAVFLTAADIETFTDPKCVSSKMAAFFAPSTSCSLLSMEIVCRYGRRGQTPPILL